MLSTQDLKTLFTDNKPDRAILRARKLAAKGRSDQALQVMKDARERLGDMPELMLETATLQVSAGRSKEAGDTLKDLLKSDPAQSGPVEELMGWARSQSADLDPIHESIAEAHIAKRNMGSAVELLERMDGATLQKSIEGRLSNLNRFLERGTAVPKSALPTLYFAALGSEVLNDWKRCFDTYRKVLAASPAEFGCVDERMKGLIARNYSQVSLRLDYAELLDGLGHRDRARQACMAALEADARCAKQVGETLEAWLESSPEDHSLMWDLVRARRAGGNIEAALEISGSLVDRKSHLSEVESLLTEVAAGGTESVAIDLLMGKVCLAEGKVARAVNAFFAALSKDAGEQGIRALEAVLAGHPEETRAYYILADHYLSQKRIDRCLETYRALLEVDPSSSATVASRLQSVLLAEPDNVEAQEMIEQASLAAGAPESSVPFLRRRLRRGPLEARDVMERLKPMLERSPEDESVKLTAAEASIATGDPEGAWTYLKEIIDPSKPADPMLLRLIVLCAGASRGSFLAVSEFIGRLPKWKDQPEVAFALAESAGRAGQVVEAVEGFRAMAQTIPATAAVCQAAIRGMWKMLKEARTPGAPRNISDRGEICAVLADALLEAGDYTSVIETLRAAVSLPAPVSVRLVTRFTEALRRQPKNPELRAALAEVYLASGRVDHAREIARAGLAGKPEAANPQLMMTYGDALARSGKLEEATRAYATAGQRDEQTAKDAIARLERVIGLDLSRETAHLALGSLLIRVGRVKDGVAELLSSWSIRADLGPTILSLLEHASRRNPGEPSVDLARSQILLGKGDPAAAAQALGGRIGHDPEVVLEVLSRLERIAAMHPTCARAHLELGRAHFEKRSASRASEALMRAYELDHGLAEPISIPLADLRREFADVPEPHLASGVVHEGASRMIPAAEAYLDAARLGGAGGRKALDGLRRISKQSNAPGRVHLLRAQACLFLGEREEAVDACRQALEGSMEPEEIRRTLERVLESHPENAAAHLYRAVALLRIGEVGSSTEGLARALQMDPCLAPDAARFAREALDREPGNSLAARVLAEALLMGDDREGAARCLDEALEIPERRRDVDLLLARRSIALMEGNHLEARALLDRAESATRDRDELLGRLHRQVLFAERVAKPASGSDPSFDEEVAAAVARGDYFLASERISSAPASAWKAWILERCGRVEEAAACLRGIMRDRAAAERFAALHDRIVARELEGRAEVLIAETALEFNCVHSGEVVARPAPGERLSGEIVEGGAK